MEQTASFSDNTLEYICGICTFKSSDQKTLVKHITGHIDYSRDHEHFLWCALCTPFGYLNARSDGQSSDAPNDSNYSGNANSSTANGDPSYYTPSSNQVYYAPVYNTNQQIYHPYYVNGVCYFSRYSENEFYNTNTLPYSNQNQFYPYAENGSNIFNTPVRFQESSTANSWSFDSVNGKHLQQTTYVRPQGFRDALPYILRSEPINSESHCLKEKSFEPHSDALYAESFSENISSDKLCPETNSKSPMDIISTDVIRQKTESKSVRVEDKSVKTSPKISSPEKAHKDITPAKVYHEITIEQISKDAGNVRPPSEYANAESPHAVNLVEPLQVESNAKCPHRKEKSVELLETSKAKSFLTALNSAKPLPETFDAKYPLSAVEPAEPPEKSKAMCSHLTVKSVEPLLGTPQDRCLRPAVKSAEPLVETSKAKCSRPPVKSVEPLLETSNDKCPRPAVKSVEHFSETFNAESLHQAVKCVEYNPETSKSKSPRPAVKNVKPLPEIPDAKSPSLDISAVNSPSDATIANLAVKTVKSSSQTTNAKSPLVDKTVKSFPETTTARCSNVIAIENFQQTVYEFPSQKVKSIEQIPETTRAKSVPTHVTTIVPIPETYHFESSRLDCSVNRSPEKIKAELPRSNVKPDESITEINTESSHFAAEAHKTLSETANAKFSMNLKILPTSANDKSSHKDIKTVNTHVRVVNANSPNVDETMTTKLRPVSANLKARNDMLKDNYLHGNRRKNTAVSTKSPNLPPDAYRLQNEKISIKENKNPRYQRTNQSFCARENLISNYESHQKNLANRNDSSALRQGSKRILSYSEVLKIGLSI